MRQAERNKSQRKAKAADREERNPRANREQKILQDTVSSQRQTTPLSRRLYYVRNKIGSNKGRSSKQSRENVNNTNRKMIPDK
jgi:hypothetical protein